MDATERGRWKDLRQNALSLSSGVAVLNSPGALRLGLIKCRRLQKVLPEIFPSSSFCCCFMAKRLYCFTFQLIIYFTIISCNYIQFKKRRSAVCMAADLLFYVCSIRFFFIFLYLLFSGFLGTVVPDGDIDASNFRGERRAIFLFKVIGGTFYVFKSDIQ